MPQAPSALSLQGAQQAAFPSMIEIENLRTAAVRCANTRCQYQAVLVPGTAYVLYGTCTEL
jgi:hypothetical protein